MAVTCAQRSRWSSLRLLLARAAIVSGILAGAWLTGATVASAASTPNTDSGQGGGPSPVVVKRSESSRVSDAPGAEKKSDDATATAEDKPAKDDARGQAEGSEPEPGKSEKADKAKQKTEAPRSATANKHDPAPSPSVPQPPPGSATVVVAPSGSVHSGSPIKPVPERQAATVLDPPAAEQSEAQSPWQPQVPASVPSSSTLSVATASASFGSLRGAPAIILPAKPDAPGSGVSARGQPKLISPSGTFASAPPASPD